MQLRRNPLFNRYIFFDYRALVTEALDMASFMKKVSTDSAENRTLQVAQDLFLEF
jgi:hypothetical protein